MENKKQTKNDVNDLLSQVFNLCTDIQKQCTKINEDIDKMMTTKTEHPAEQSTPTMQDVAMYFDETNKTIRDERFYNYNEKRNWKVEGQPIKDWKVLADSWQKAENNLRGGV